MNRDTIEQYLPHREPMLLLDRIESHDEQQLVCSKQFRADEFFFQGHYPDFPLVPGVILCEAGMQAGALLLAMSGTMEAGVPVATRMNDVKFKRMIRPGDTVEITAEQREQVANAYFMTAKITCEGKLAARLDFACTVSPAPGS